MQRAIHMGDCLTLFDHWPTMRLLLQQHLTDEVASVEPDQMDGIGLCLSPIPDDQWDALVSIFLRWHRTENRHSHVASTPV